MRVRWRNCYRFQIFFNLLLLSKPITSLS
ncbi:hypothetical protein NC652_027351 [Populus alba x Populus x berolinensis]|nr:hypothetical protein NC652_027351 [Populus alba x Populus x berolinensis]